MYLMTLFKAERARIVNAGGYIEFGRVNGSILLLYFATI